MRTSTYQIAAALLSSVVIRPGSPVLAQATEQPLSQPADQLVHQTVQIDTGKVQGAVADEVLSFKGIPYAASPVGDLRWRSPQPVQPWSGVRPAIQYGNDCMQYPDPSDAAPPGTPPAEDCLVMNIWRPAQRNPGEKLPVVVWIHGGGFVNGGSSTPIYDGNEIAQQGIVFVSFNYRLGRFGFFAHPALLPTQEGASAENSEAIANYGLMDQLAALQWVQRNVAAFGGDPQRVTLMGESAGGVSVMHLLTWPAAQGLFHQAVVLSGGGRNYLSNLRKLRESSFELPSAIESGVRFATSMGIKDKGPAGLAALRALPAAKIAGDLNMTNLLKRPPTYAGGPILDRNIVRATPGEILQRGEATKIPLIVGSTSQDLPVLLPPLKDPLSYFGANAAKARALYDPNGILKPLDLVFAIGADITMHEPARFVAQHMTAAGQPAWLYRFGYVAQALRPQLTGATHASELPFLFGTLTARYGDAVTEQEQDMGHMFRSYVVNFIKTGNPNGRRLPLWVRFNPARSQLMLFTPDNGAVFQTDPWKERLDLVEQVANSQ